MAGWIGLIVVVMVVFWMLANRPVSVVTMDEYSRLHEGMTYRQVVSIIGAEGVEQASSRLPALEGVMGSLHTASYSWQNPDGSNMSAVFQNDRMTIKAQFGLR